jgi:hypothetical protein
LAGLLRRVVVTFEREDVTFALPLRWYRVLKVEMAALDHGLHANVLQIEIQQVPGIDRRAISEPDQQKQEYAQSP